MSADTVTQLLQIQIHKTHVDRLTARAEILRKRAEKAAPPLTPGELRLLTVHNLIRHALDLGVPLALAEGTDASLKALKARGIAAGRQIGTPNKKTAGSKG